MPHECENEIIHFSAHHFDFENHHKRTLQCSHMFPMFTFMCPTRCSITIANFFPQRLTTKYIVLGCKSPSQIFKKIWVPFLVYIRVPSVVPLPKIVTNSFGNKSFMLSMKRLLTCKSRGVRFFLLGEGELFLFSLVPKRLIKFPRCSQ